MAADLRRMVFFALLGAAICAIGQAQVAQPPRAAPLFSGKTLPNPPQQGEPWAPPKSGLPEQCVSAIQALVRFGFANPRACEYREVELSCGSVWGGAYVFKTRGWLIPSQNPGEGQRFAVSWSGLVYPVVASGDVAHLRADVQALLAQKVPRFGSSAPMEQELVSQSSVNELKVGMLLLLGETEAAEQLWKKVWPNSMPESYDPFLWFAHAYAWAHYDRAIGAHMRGDDVISLISAQVALRLRDDIEKEVVARGSQRPAENLAKPNFEFLKNVDVLVADQQRRVASENVERVFVVGIDKFPDQKQRIAALIRDLDKVSARQWAQPGGVDLGQDPIVQALIKEGEAAMEPLMQCFESDVRLTRSVGFHRDFFTNRYFLGVDDAAYRAISSILKVSSFGPATEHTYFSPINAAKRAEVAKEIRGYWNRVRGVAELDRWYQTLADDSASREQWLEMIRKITGSAPREPGAANPPPIVSALAPPRPMAGEALRHNRSPSVSELLVKRAEAISQMEMVTSMRTVRMAEACEVGLALAKWEPASALPEVKKWIGRGFALLDDPFYGSGNFRMRLIPQVTQLCAWAIEAGDSGVAEQYAAWLRRLTPDRVEKFRTSGEFYALQRFPEEPAIATAARAVFQDRDSPWRPLHAKVSGPLFRELVSAAFIGVPAVREMVKQELQNRTVSDASLKVNHQEHSYSVLRPGENSGRRPTDFTDPAWTSAKDQPLRVCDLYAWELTTLEGSPVFEPYWPVERRDAAIAELELFLDRWGDCFRLLARIPPERIRFPSNQAAFHISKLERAATPEDVKESRAIFSLQDGTSEVRVPPLPMFPQPARWKTLDRFPVRYAGQTAEQTQYDRAGYIWQAEEILVDGNWQRYYGFVGNHVIAKVAAEEIELLEKPGEERFMRVP
jgi:hypothetical protein